MERDTPGNVTVELFGVPCVLAGRRAVTVSGRSLAEAAADLAAVCPELVGPVLGAAGGWLAPGYAFVVDGRFGCPPETTICADSAVLLASSLVGG